MDTTFKMKKVSSQQPKPVMVMLVNDANNTFEVQAMMPDEIEQLKERGCSVVLVTGYHVYYMYDGLTRTLDYIVEGVAVVGEALFNVVDR